MSSSVEAVLWDETKQAWLDDYPSLERHELERRLESRECVAALFELLLHATLKRHRAQVVVHPTSVSKTEKRPDFLAVFPDGHEVVFESVMVNELSVKEVSTSNAWTELLNHINRVDSDFWINVDRHPGPLPSPPPPRKVRAFLERELAKLDVTVERARMESRRGWQGLSRQFEIGETILTFRFSPKMSIHRGTTENMPALVGICGMEPSKALRKPLLPKGAGTASLVILTCWLWQLMRPRHGIMRPTTWKKRCGDTLHRDKAGRCGMMARRTG